MTELTEALRRLASAAVDSARTGRPVVDWRDAAAAFGIRLRLVRLRGRSWWLKDCGPLLAFRTAGGAPVVLTRTVKRGYVVFDPESGAEIALDASTAAGFRHEAFMPYPGPGFAIHRCGRTWQTIDVDVLLQLACGTAVALIAFAMLLLIVSGVRPGATPVPARLWAISFGWIGVAAAFATLEEIGALAGLRWRARTNLHLHASLWNRVIGLPLARFRSTPATEMADAVDRVIADREDVTAERGGARFAVPSLLAAVAILVLTSPVVAGAAVAAVAALLLLQYRIAREHQRSLRRELEHRPAARRARWLVASHLPALRALGARDWALEAERAASEQELTAAMRAALLRRSNEALRRYGPALVPIAVLAADRPEFWADGLVLALISLVAGSAACRIASASARIREIDSRAAETDHEVRDEPARQGSRPIPGLVQRVEVVSAGFVYAGSCEPSLDNVSFEFRRGECVAIAGPSGSGKTTLVRLLTGLEHPTSGAVRVNGIDLRSVDPGDYRRRVGAVFQDQAIPISTICGTILGMAPIEEDDAWEAARVARIADTIANLPMGMQTMVAMATVPSAMLNQLLIARTLARRPEIVVFDETFSNLDDEVQSGMVSDLRRGGTTMVICSHRPSTIALADRVIRLDHGRIVA